MYYKNLHETEEAYDLCPDRDGLLRSFKENDTETIVFHPDDPTTDFLIEIYQGKGWNVASDPFINQETVTELINSHKRVICLGHGSNGGLFGAYEMIINDSLVPLLRNKSLVFIWCNADQFIQQHDLKASLFSGMFLSECQEADLFGIPYEDELQIELSNDLFASVLGKHINSGDDNILDSVKREYQDENDSVITFNRNRLYNTTDRGGLRNEGYEQE